MTTPIASTPSHSYRKFKNFLAKFRYWPLHPQWLIYRHESQYYQQLSAQIHGRVLDLGCANQVIKTYLSPTVDYFGLDYYHTAIHWYDTRPQFYANAQQLPVRDNSMDTVLLLDVLEHLPAPEQCLAEIARVLKPQGILILKVPFLYPIHDAPLDFHRWTIHGLQQLAGKYQLTLRHLTAVGKPLETAGLLANLALSKMLINEWQQGHLFRLLGLLLLVPSAILSINLSAWLLSLLNSSDDWMPHSYRLRLECTKPS